MICVDSVRLARNLLLLAGTLWGVWYLGMNLVGWGEPGSVGYRRYETYNRFAVVILGALAASTWMAHRHLCGHYARAG